MRPYCLEIGFHQGADVGGFQSLGSPNKSLQATPPPSGGAVELRR
jgi:hypothetical protein